MAIKKLDDYCLKTFIIDNEVHSYKLFQCERYKRLTIKSNDQSELVVLAPLQASIALIEQFVAKHARKILGFIDHKGAKRLIDLENQKMRLLGYEFSIKTLVNSKKQMQINLPTNNQIQTIFFFVPQEFLKDYEKQRKFIVKYLKCYGKSFLIKRFQFYCQKFNLQTNGLELKQFKRKWGWCSNRQIIALNILLICQPIDVIDYVICHELAHLTHLNHSIAFWNLVEQYLPNYKEVHKKLHYQST